jgi:predicted nuclease of predicted toxin-antitoxin system
MLRPALLLDENIQYGLTPALRQRGWDVVHVKDIGLRGAKDPEVLEAAIRAHRITLTYNIDDFSRLDDEFREAGQTHPSIIMSVERSIGELVRRLESFDFSHIESIFAHL